MRKKPVAAKEERSAGLRVPRPDLFEPPPPERRRPVQATPAVAELLHPPRFCFMGAHGGSGAGLMARLSRVAHDEALARFTAGHEPGPGPFWFGSDAGTCWPAPGTVETVVVVCQTTMSGLEWARDVARQYLSGHAPAPVRVLGLISIADQPGKPGPQIVNSRTVLDGVYAKHWQIPFVPQYRLFRETEPALPAMHPAIDSALHSIRSTILEGL